MAHTLSFCITINSGERSLNSFSPRTLNQETSSLCTFTVPSFLRRPNIPYAYPSPFWSSWRQGQRSHDHPAPPYQHSPSSHLVSLRCPSRGSRGRGPRAVRTRPLDSAPNRWHKQVSRIKGVFSDLSTGVY